MRAVLADSTEVLGPAHPQTLLIRSNLAVALLDAGEYEPAEDELRGVLDRCLETLGPADANTLSTRTNLALLLLSTQRPGEAAAELAEVVAIRSRTDGPVHPDTLAARHYLAGAQAALGNRERAESEYREVLAARTQRLGENHPATRNTRDALGLLLDPVPSFNVVMLGTRGVGKSVLLASMFHHMTTGEAVDGVRLRADKDTSTHLARLYRDVADGDDWPAGTTIGDLRTFTFELVTRHDRSEQPLLTIDYLEYAGGLLVDPVAPGSEQLDRLVRAITVADAVFIMLDGVRLRNLLLGEQRGKGYLDAVVPLPTTTASSGSSPAWWPGRSTWRSRSAPWCPTCWPGRNARSSSRRVASSPGTGPGRSNCSCFWPPGQPSSPGWCWPP
jgi:tetratricopeptide (TPR) repeat protein